MDSIEKWTDSLHIFVCIYLTANPSKCAELLKYIHIVKLGAASSREAHGLGMALSLDSEKS